MEERLLIFRGCRKFSVASGQADDLVVTYQH